MKYHRPKDHEAQQMLRLCREKLGRDDVSAEEVVTFAKSMGVRVPDPIPGEKLLEQSYGRAFRAESKYDPEINGSYRINHVYPGMRNGKQTMLWGNIHTMSRPAMVLSGGLRRKQMVNDGYHLKLDVTKWNLLHNDEDPIQVVFNLTDDIAEMESADGAGEAGNA
jgi:hypothetical protein